MDYDRKLQLLRDLFGEKDISLEENRLVVHGCNYPIIDDVIILLDPSQYPPVVRKRLGTPNFLSQFEAMDFAEDIQYTFGEEWKKYSELLPEHEKEFYQYFDLVDHSELENFTVCDLGCGMGRWSYFLCDKCRELILIDFSEAIFLARRNLSHADNTLFFMGDLKRLPFTDDFADLVFCLDVLHTLPTSAIDEIRNLKKYSPRLLIYLYYALDNRPAYFQTLFSLADALRLRVHRFRKPLFRFLFTWLSVMIFYMPLILAGMLSKPLGISHRIPLYETYHGKSLKRICQDAYDRFFTGIEQRYRRKEILRLEDSFTEISISEKLPYWHFLCIR